MDKPGEFELPDNSPLDWHAPETLKQLCSSAKKSGFLEDVELMSVMTDSGHEEFLLTVRVANGVVLASTTFNWQQVRPPSGLTGTDAASCVLQYLDRTAQRTRAGLDEYAWLRIAGELRQVRGILEQGLPG